MQWMLRELKWNVPIIQDFSVTESSLNAYLSYNSAKSKWGLCGNTLWKNNALWKTISKCVKFGTNLAHFEIFFSKRVKFGTNLAHFHFFFQSALRVYINFPFHVNFKRTLKNIDEVKIQALCFHLIDGISKFYNSLISWE